MSSGDSRRMKDGFAVLDKRDILNTHRYKQALVFIVDAIIILTNKWFATLYGERERRTVPPFKKNKNLICNFKICLSRFFLLFLQGNNIQQ